MIPLFRNTITSNTNSNLPVFPPSLVSAVVFDFDAKHNAGFNLRTDMGVDYVVDYTCPVSGIVVSQSVASRQPVKHTDYCYFDGIDDVIYATANLNEREVWVVCQTNRTTFASYDCPFAGYATLTPTYFALFGKPGTKDVYYSPSYCVEQRINNVLTIDFSPMNLIKTWSAWQVPNNSKDVVIGGYIALSGYYWQGQIRRVLIFNDVLTTTQRNNLQAYLQAYHGF